MNPKGRELAEAIRREVEHWPGVRVEFTEGGKHPKAKLWFLGKMLARPFAGTPGADGAHNTLSEMRRIMKQLGATRDKPEPTKDEDDATYRKPNNGAAKRPPPVAGEKAKPKPDVADQLVAAGAASPEQAEAARRDPVKAVATSAFAGAVADQYVPADEDEDEAERQARIDALIAQVEAIEDGIYFGLPEAVYHAVPRLSASGLQRLCVSPATFWRGSWLDPDAPALDEEQTNAQLLGKAYHCARLEPDRFHGCYCRKPDKADFAGQKMITADTGVKAALKDLGEPQSAGTESTVERAQRLRDCGHEGPIWCLIMDEFEQQRAGRVPIEARYFDQIVEDMQRIRGSGEIAALLVGGQAEVSIFWTDRHDLKCKCRLDYLTPEWWDDFKTFDNSRGKVLEQALADAMRFNRYYVQAVHYRDGVEAVRTGGLQIVGEATDAQRAMIAAIQIRPEELACWYVFQEKGGVPNLLAREFPFYDVPWSVTSDWDTGATEDAVARGHDATRRPTGLFARGRTDVLHAKDQFVLYSNAYDPGTPWFPLNARARFSDLDFNTYWIEGKV